MRNSIPIIVFEHAQLCGKSSDTFKFKFVARFSTSIVAAAILSACTVSNGETTADLDINAKQTASVESAILDEDGIAASDTEIIKTTVASIEEPDDTTNLMSWHNPDTGNKGTIIALQKVISGNGKKCKKFQTTVDTFKGISIYDGKTCELKQGYWVMSKLAKSAENQ